MIRAPAVAGQFYPYSREMLQKQVEESIDKKSKKEHALGAMCPHAGYMYSGKPAGLVYSRMKIPDTLVILGPNHTGIGADFAIMTDGIWRMPLGEVKIDKPLAEEIFKNSKVLEDDFTAHQHEHSIEVQLPFIQYFSDDFQFVPITMRHYAPDDEYLNVCTDIANAIATAVKNTRESVTIIASSDLTHYEPHEVANKKDHAILDAVLELDAKKLLQVVRDLRVSMCGFGPVTVMLLACKKLGAKKAELVKYMTSGDVTKDYGAVVGYGGVIVK